MCKFIYRIFPNKGYEPSDSIRIKGYNYISIGDEVARTLPTITKMTKGKRLKIVNICEELAEKYDLKPENPLVPLFYIDYNADRVQIYYNYCNILY